ncbi:MAG: hypothetical protein IM650_12780 [Phenylobacterium sp.]|uniref:CBU_0592 family membrane protein n=1 Tax=Phenylobacterium sp. TaxID=1871053 RepID=UPI0025FB417A|nr:hypothetical protein [Phenylobacterium sp.]MCA3514924.1 hypothetical protein [Rhodobacter sp.]MCA6225545.1 hypothetical protein [Phenylobacterium sp.]MCA6258955.1 hypothetical protein [Phenylobacterium sp.]MCA6267868.1 hypothetical protein [Phenylobacterium sp.]MCA6268392.1 hypothetical protein [Phenylobacterium sp.]
MMSTIIGSLGVGLILLAFAALHLRRAAPTGRIYLTANAIGAGLACLSSVMIEFLPFVILEGVWCAIAVGGLVRSFLGDRPMHFGRKDDSRPT